MSLYSLSITNLYLNSLSMMNLHNHGIDGDMQVFEFLLAFVLVLAVVFILIFLFKCCATSESNLDDNL